MLNQDVTETSVGFAPSSWSSTLGVSEALASYSRSQVIITGQNVASSLDTDERTETLDDEARYSISEVEEPLNEDELQTPMAGDEDTSHDNFEWDDVLNGPNIVQPEEAERMPLIRKPSSKSSVRVEQPYTVVSGGLEPPALHERPKLRRKSSASARSEKDVAVGRSTFGQTVSTSLY